MTRNRTAGRRTTRFAPGIAAVLALGLVGAGVVPVAGLVDLAQPAVAAEGDVVTTNPARPAGLEEPDKVADPATHHEYPGSDSLARTDTTNYLEYFDSSRNQGRIWTDKSVFNKDVGIPKTMDQDPGELKVGPDELAVALSALGSTRHVMSTEPVPIDVVLVLDNSYSMTQCVESDAFCRGPNVWQDSRAAAMADAVNSAIQIIHEDDPDNRVAIVLFGTNSEVVTGLVNPQPTGSRYVWLTQSGNSNTNGVLTLHVGNQTRTIGTSGSDTQYTNIQRGLTTGLGLLASQAKAAVTGSEQRVPNLILFTDGEPTRSSTSQSWWNPSGSAVQGPSSTGSAFYGNGFLAALSASLLKAKVEAHYNDADYNRSHGLVGVDANVYTVGLGINGLATSARDIALATLDPSANLGKADGIYGDFTSTFNAYKTGGRPNVPVNTGVDYRINHPAAADAGFREFDPTTDADFKYNKAFFSPMNTEELKKDLDRIAETIIEAAPNYPVEVRSDNASTEGYITFVDELGPYMEVTDFNRIAFCSFTEASPTKCIDKTFLESDIVDEGGGTFSYIFDGEYEANTVSGSDGPVDLSAIKITVTKGASLADGDVVTMSLPAALLPIYDKRVMVDSDGEPVEITPYISHPFHAYYKVAPKPAVLSYLAGINTTSPEERAALAAYVEANTGDGTVRFYSNAHSGAGSDAGLATSSFTPALRNDFYRFSVDSPLYIDDEFKEALTGANWDATQKLAGGDNLEIFYMDVAYVRAGDSLERVPFPVATTAGKLKAAGFSPSGTGPLVAPAGMLDLSDRTANLDFPKCAVEWVAGLPECYDPGDPEFDPNPSNTAATVRTTTSERGQSGGSDAVTAALGNNGFLAYDAPGTLTVRKTVEHDGFDPLGATEFTFRLDVAGDEGDGGDEEKPGFPADVYASDDTFLREDSVVVGGTLTLKDGEYAVIYGLPHGTDYTVTELDIPDGYTLDGENPRFGTIDSSEPSEEEFVNTYEATPATAAPTVTKVLAQGEWDVKDTFTFLLCEGVTEGCQELTLTHGDVAEPGEGVTATGVFGGISFDRPGTYEYTLTEKDENTVNPSISYSAASYLWTVTVVDDGRGVLTATGVLTQVLGDGGQSLVPPLVVADGDATFTNVRDANQVSGTLQATKLAWDKTLVGGAMGNPTRAHEFDFKYLGAINGEPTAASEPQDLSFVDDTHLLGDPRGSWERKTNVAGSSAVSSSELTFTRAHVGHRLYYSVEEVETSDTSFVSTDPVVYIYEIAVGVDTETEVLGGMNPVTAMSVRCATTRDEVTDHGPLGTCRPGTDSFNPTTSVPALFQNEYEAGPVVAPLAATKELVGRDWYGDDAFTFRIEGDNTTTRNAIAAGYITLLTGDDPAVGVTLPAEISVTTEGVENVKFNLQFTRQGTYRFKITEVPGSAGGMTYSENSLVYTVTVSNPGDDDQSALVATSAWYSGDATFINRYEPAQTSATPWFSKLLKGRNWLPDEEFTFVIDGVVKDGVEPPMPAATTAKVTSANAVRFDFGSIVFDKAGTYTYVVSEQVPSDKAPGLDYDGRSATVTIVVKDSLEAELGAEVSYGGGFREFVNTYATELPWGFDVTKALTGREMAADEFTFKVVPGPGASERFGAQAALTVHGAAGDDGQVVTMDGPRVTFTQDDAGKNYCWEVSEDVPTEPLPGIAYDPVMHSVCVDVSDPGLGVLTATTRVTSLGGSGGGAADPIVITSAGGNPPWPAVPFENRFEPTSWTLAKTSDPADGHVERGDEITYTLTVVEDIGGAGSAVPTGIVVTDDLSDVIGPGRAEFIGFIGDHGGATFDAESGMLTWELGTFEESATLSYKVLVDDEAYGVTLRNVVTGTGNVPPETCDQETEIDELEDVCTTVHTTGPGWTMSKSANPEGDELLAPGDTVEYTLEVMNLSKEFAVTDIVVTDDLAEVLADGVVALVLDESGELAQPAVGAARLEGTTLVWDLAELAPGQTAEFTYSVTTKADGTAYGTTLRNKAWGVAKDGDAVLPPEDCTVGRPCSTEHEVATPEWTVVKSSDTEGAVPGGVITYELTVTNKGEVPLYGATISDGPVGHGGGVTDVWDFLDADGWDGKYTVQVGDDGEATDYTDATPEDGLQHVIDELGVEEQAVVTFTVQLPDKFDGVHLRNTVVGSLIPNPAGPGEPDGPSFPPQDCALPNGEKPCSVDHTYPPGGAWTLDKSAETPSGTSAVLPGDVVTYTLTVENTGTSVVTGVVITDDLAEVLADGVVTLDALVDPEVGAVRLEGTTLVWDVGDLEPEEKVEYTYSVTVKADAKSYGATLHNAAWGTGHGVTEDGPDEALPPENCTEDEPCSTDHEVATPQWTVAKSSDTQIAVPGGEITYELTVTNTGEVPLYGATISDGPVGHGESVTDIWDLLANGGSWDGEYTVQIGEQVTDYTDATPADGLQLTVDGLGVGEQAVVAFTVQLPDQLAAVHVRNTVTGSLIPDPAGPGEPEGRSFPPEDCAVSNGAAPCSADHVYTPPAEWTAAKTAETPSGTSTVEPGDTVVYTLTVQNTGLSPVTGVIVTDDLSAVLADGLVTLDSLMDPVQGSVSLDGTTLTWDVGTLAVGEPVTYSYSVTVSTDEDVWGLTLHNAAWGTGRGPTDEVLEPVWCTEAAPCTTDHEVGIPDPEPDPEPTGHGLPAPTDPEPDLPEPTSPVSGVSAARVSSGGALASTGGKVTALAAAGLLLTAGVLIVRRRREEPAD
ncbi:LPXTG-motif cell wall anchor domain protein [Xylanimonas cellulosilytica DSM 15894]|uniref:LPXTG-motif cell wall anchor domain protein n=1 Tax=Xylanimonas cellulosilytica (strain DSM 15894 / JCM 12276 / CECT 5975 / KCTC 9989 / LMG 20990 / NBRC 107835 / XIL07) TaxID=446471 RepID=D1BU23_XYLCX|nr:FctA domain-containing protein [Xylanimonas cellulosilytica]ACZ29187.1 LPXTG-motif cell wall anchor domain protein [Xylanimonas cellulosilytica DSM 15894]